MHSKIDPWHSNQNIENTKGYGADAGLSLARLVSRNLSFVVVILQAPTSDPRVIPIHLMSMSANETRKSIQDN